MSWSEEDQKSGDGAWVFVSCWWGTSSDSPSGDVLEGSIEFWVIPVVEDWRWLSDAWFDGEWDNSGDSLDMGAWAWVDEVGWLLSGNNDPSGDDGVGVVEDWDGVVVWDWSWSHGGAIDWHDEKLVLKNKL